MGEVEIREYPLNLSMLFSKDKVVMKTDIERASNASKSPSVPKDPPASVKIVDDKKTKKFPDSVKILYGAHRLLGDDRSYVLYKFKRYQGVVKKKVKELTDYIRDNMPVVDRNLGYEIGDGRIICGENDGKKCLSVSFQVSFSPGDIPHIIHIDDQAVEGAELLFAPFNDYFDCVNDIEKCEY